MRVVVVVDNPVIGDSRVQKQARSATEAGHDVIVVGLSVREVVGPDSIDGIPVLRFTVPSRYYTWEHRGHLLREEEVVTVGHANAAAVYASSRSATAQIDGDTVAAAVWQVRGKLAPMLSKLQRAPRRAGRAARGSLRRLAGRALPRWWRLSSAHLVDLENTLVPILLGLAPDLIHVNDPQPLGAAIRARTLLAPTKKVAVLYDAHEWWQAVAAGDLTHHVGAYGIEQLHAADADAVVTVTADIAARLQRRYRLATEPTVVRNLPLASKEAAPGRAPVREEIGLDAHTPLLVYSGALHARRGVAEAVASLATLPGVHLAIITGTNRADLSAVLDLADRLGVTDRIHVRDYVPSRSVSWYLGGATLGLSLMRRHPNHDLAVPTKLAEYLHAGLPLVVSDCPAQAEFVRSRGAGAVYRAGDALDLARAIAESLNTLGNLEGKARSAVGDLSWERDATSLIALYERLGPAPAPAAARSGEIVVGGGRIAAALVASGAMAAAREHRTESDAVSELLRARGAERVIFDGSPAGFQPLGHPMRVANFLESSGTQTALLLHDDADVDDVDGLLEQVRVLVTSPHLLERVERARWLPLVAAEAASRVGAGLDAGAPVRRIAYRAGLAPSWLGELRKVAERYGVETVESPTWEQAEIFVDDRRADRHSELRVDHLAAGAVVIAHESRGPAEQPLMTATDSDAFAGVLEHLIADIDARATARRAGADYAAAHHTPAAIRDQVDRLLG